LIINFHIAKMLREHNPVAIAKDTSRSLNQITLAPSPPG